MVILLDEICTRHDLTSFMEGNFGDVVGSVVDVGGTVFLSSDEGLG